jgi:hypothetical protein
MKRLASIVLVAALSVCPAGCGVGTNSLIFTTKTNVGLDIDTTPPTAQLSIGRSEAVFAPAFEGGQTPPVMASFRYEGEGIFSPRLATTFSAGDAAVTMAELFAAPTPPDKADDRKNRDSALRLSAKPVPDGGRGSALFEPGRVAPLIFGTDTSFGLKVAWSGLTASAPDALRLGFNRKELAWAPVTYHEEVGEDGTPLHVVKAPSLLATVDFNAEAGSLPGTKPAYLQYFATGAAATSLAQEQEVRRAMLTRLDPEAARSFAHYSEEGACKERLRAWLEAGDVPEGTGDASAREAEAERRSEALRRALEAEGILPEGGFPVVVWLNTASEAQRCAVIARHGAAMGMTGE